MRRMAVAFTFIFFLSFSTAVLSEETETLPNERMEFYLRFSDDLVPWYHLAAIDQYERNIRQVRQDLPKVDGPISILHPPELWAGAVNPDLEDVSPFSIGYFGGHGEDGDLDGIADRNNPADVLATIHKHLLKYGPAEDGFRTALEDFYGKEETVKQVMAIAKLFSHFETIDLDEHRFPIPKEYNYTYKGTWGAKRGWGGRRIHEGTDIFAGYGVPVRATSYGVIEVMGWNEYGGWRVGIRDNHNTYHYFAHLAYFNKDISEGDVVEPGTVIGFVGSSGYGKEGTSGKFPPHLHYGMYKYNGRTEWSFDPYPSLRTWENQK